MADETAAVPPERLIDGPHCPWCSAALPDVEAASCPSCGARLVAPEGVAVPGVTELDSTFVTGGSLARNPRSSLNVPFLGGSDRHDPTPEELNAVAHPDVAVRREILRLELEARLLQLRNEARAMETEAVGLADDPPAVLPVEPLSLATPGPETPRPEMPAPEAPGPEPPAADDE